MPHFLSTNRKFCREAGSLSGAAYGINGAAVEKDDLADHGKAKPQSSAGLAGGIDLVEALPDFVQVFCRDADSVILHLEDGLRVLF